ncbi:MAG: 2-amino-4-hydroxy-6-hydroxymethyldihydropteridine pyrophosphokinase, partial [Bacteroides sp.]
FAGRQPEDKAQELVKLDIDLLIYNHQILKSKDLERDYIKELICLMD